MTFFFLRLPRQPAAHTAALDPRPVGRDGSPAARALLGRRMKPRPWAAARDSQPAPPTDGPVAQHIPIYTAHPRCRSKNLIFFSFHFFYSILFLNKKGGKSITFLKIFPLFFMQISHFFSNINPVFFIKFEHHFFTFSN